MNGMNGMEGRVQRLEIHAPRGRVTPVDDGEDELTSEELDGIYQRFLALDENKIPAYGEGARQVKKDHVIFTLSRINYRSTRDSIALHLSWGKPLDVTYAEEMAMWLDEYEA